MNIFKAISLFCKGFAEGWQEAREEQREKAESVVNNDDDVVTRQEDYYMSPLALNELEAQRDFYFSFSDDDSII